MNSLSYKLLNNLINVIYIKIRKTSVIFFQPGLHNYTLQLHSYFESEYASYCQRIHVMNY